jgi:LysR family transcriptional activator of nhaA
VELVLRSGTSSELLQGLDTLNLDVVLTNQPTAPDAMTHFVSHQLSQQPVSLIGTAARLAPRHDLDRLLAANPVILPTRENPVRAGFDALCARHDIRPLIAAEVDDMAMMRLLAREGIGLAVLPPIVVKNELESGLLVELQHDIGLSERFFAVTIERKFPNPLLQVLFDHRLSI